ncbi:MAG: radical SAM protein [Candidatus Eremiobacteraeota bacterium]|nr:radical SAM protein [Candidatus Eremiobacteraeota bacterium]
MKKNLRIKLIMPRMSLRPVDSEFKRLMAPSLSLLTVAALTPKEHSIAIDDENTRPLSFDMRPDLVGITVNVDTSRRAYEIAGRYRQLGVPVVMGGIHASANPEEVLSHADSVCIGPANGIWEKIVSDAASRGLRRFYRRGEGGEVPDIPLPRWDLVDTSRYLYSNIVSTSAGCPFSCEFCYNSSGYMGGRTLLRPLESVIREVESLPTKHVMFIDDNFIADTIRAMALAKALRPLGLRWNAAVSADIVHHDDLLDEMALSGCRSLFIGFESINPDSLKSVRKGQNDRALFEKLIAGLHDRGIMINASMVFGLDSDCPEVFSTTLRWLVEQKAATMTAHILTPYPGTDLFRRFVEEKRITDFDWSHYNTSSVVFQPRRMSPRELSEGYLWIYRKFYETGSILSRLPRRRSLWASYLLFNVLYKKFGRAASRAARCTGTMAGLGRMARLLSYGIF